MKNSIKVKNNLYRYIILLFFVGLPFSIKAQTFTSQEVQNIVAYWNQPQRYSVTKALNQHQQGPWQIRLSHEGSMWLWKYNKARKSATAPNKIPLPQNEEQKLWDTWIDRKIEYDRWHIKQLSEAANFHWSPRTSAPLQQDLAIPYQPIHPGPIPEGLYKIAGNPPCFARLATPLRHVIQFDNDHIVEFNDNININSNLLPRFAYYRFPNGISYKSPSISAQEFNQLFHEAGLNEFERKVIKAVSELEGGFETLNTYDTGYVSVGFVQFTTGHQGKGTLCKLLKQYRIDYPEAYNNDFRRFGIDINLNDTLNIVDPYTGAQLAGSEAVAKLIDDKRLIAVFQRASAKSRSFRITQIKTAKNLYYPAEKLLKITIQGNVMQIPVKNIFRSEAGMATVLDRNLNTGNITIVESRLSAFAQRQSISNPLELSNYEKALIQAITYRKNFLLSRSLSQPR